MTPQPHIVNRNGQHTMAPGGIALTQYTERARRCSACEHRSADARCTCALMPNRPPFSLGLAMALTHEPVVCPEGRWADENAPQADIVDALKPMDAQTSMMQRMAHGATGLAKAAMGLDRADDATIATRYALCMACDRHAIGLCTACGCLCAAKVRVAGEACPEGKWSASPASQAE